MFYLFNKVLGTVNMVWGLANQVLEDSGKLLGDTIGDRSTTGHYRPGGVSGLWILGRP